jgi:hypothetical protein
MLRIIEDLARDWRRLDERIEGLSVGVWRTNSTTFGMPRISTISSQPSDLGKSLQSRLTHWRLVWHSGKNGPLVRLRSTSPSGVLTSPPSDSHAKQP